MIFVLSFLLLLNSDRGYIEWVRTKNYEGVIFNDHYEVLLGGNKKAYKNRFTPEVEMIHKMERKLKSKIRSLNNEKINQGEGWGPYIHKNLKNYKRQYLGRIDEEGEKYLYINFIWFESSTLDQLDNNWIVVFDGGSHYWTVFYHLKKKEFMNMEINNGRADDDVYKYIPRKTDD